MCISPSIWHICFIILCFSALNLQKMPRVCQGSAPPPILHTLAEVWWHSLPKPFVKPLWNPFPLFSGVVFMAGNVYAVGGFNGSLRVRTVDVYDGVKDQWTSIASMQERRSTLGAAVLNDLLYAVGGFDGSTGRWWGKNQAVPDLTNVFRDPCRALVRFLPPSSMICRERARDWVYCML